MNRAERDSFVATTDQTDLAYGESACLETPPDLFNALDQEFRFDVDLAANERNNLRPCYLGPESPYGIDALTVPWGRHPNLGYGNHRVGFCNPAYGTFAAKMVEKAVHESLYNNFTSVFLLPMRVNRMFKSFILAHAYEIRFVDERITFWYQGKPKATARVKWRTGAYTEPRYLNIEGYVWDEEAAAFVLEPAGALFDSIVVVFSPQRGQLHFGPRVSVWHWNADRRKKLLNGS